MTHNKTRTLKTIWFHHELHSQHIIKGFDWVVPAIILGLCLTLIAVYAWSFYLYQSLP